jgi:hypothetical protein
VIALRHQARVAVKSIALPHQAGIAVKSIADAAAGPVAS